MRATVPRSSIWQKVPRSWPYAQQANALTCHSHPLAVSQTTLDLFRSVLHTERDGHTSYAHCVGSGSSCWRLRPRWRPSKIRQLRRRYQLRASKLVRILLFLYLFWLCRQWAAGRESAFMQCEVRSDADKPKKRSSEMTARFESSARDESVNPPLHRLLQTSTASTTIPHILGCHHGIFARL